MRDLEGITVVSIEQAVAAPYASSRLADAGARVIKVERPEGDLARRYDAVVNGGSAYFVWLNRGKESIALDLKAAEDLALVKAMIDGADVFLQNLVPGALDRLGLSLASLRARNPRLITCSISGYGSEGPLRDRKAYDLLVQAESGLCTVTGTPEGPARIGVSACDIAAGMNAHQAILSALFARTRTGEGRDIEVSLFHAAADWMNVPYLQHRYGGTTPKRMGLKHPTIAPYGAYACADGKSVLISIQNEREWQRLCAEVVGDASLATRPGFATNIERTANRAAVDAVFSDFFAGRSRAEAIALLEAAGISFGALSDLDDLASHPQNRVVEVATEHGPVSLLAPAARAVGETVTLGPVPALNEHGDALRREFSPS